MDHQLGWKDNIISFIKESFAILVRYFTGRLKISLILGVVCYIVLWILDIRLKLLISFIVAAANLVPYIGPMAAMVISALIVIFQNPIYTLWVTVMSFGLQLLDSFVLSPLILGKSLGLPAIVVLVAIIVGGSVFSFWGIVFAVPVAAIISLLIRKIRNRKQHDEDNLH